MQGAQIDEQAAATLCNAIYLRILDQLKHTFGLPTVEEILDASRPLDSLQEFSSFLRLRKWCAAELVGDRTKLAKPGRMD
jgi:hypothetical protein